MRTIMRIRPQGKRKAVNAMAFCSKYIDAANHAASNGDERLEQEMLAKRDYWLARFKRYQHHV